MCIRDRDYNEGVVTVIREQLLKLAGLDGEYTTVLLQGSGTYAVDATLSCAVRPPDKLLIVANGAYGKRMGDIARRHGLNHVLVSLKETAPVTEASELRDVYPICLIRKVRSLLTKKSVRWMQTRL